MEVNGKPDDDTTHTKITTTVEETTTTTTTNENPEESITKKQKTSNENTVKSDFDVSARKYIDWIDNIERILDEKPASQLQPNERDDIIQVNNQNFVFIN